MNNSLKILTEASVEQHGSGDSLMENIVRIDVRAENVPKDLFGVSFHLGIEGVDWKLKGFESGNVFGNTEPMILVKEKDKNEHLVITGLSSRAGDSVLIKDGVLISFFVEPYDNGNLKMFFKNGVVTVFDVARKDLTNVIWEGGQFGIEGVSVSEELASFNEGDAVDDKEVLSAGLTEVRADVIAGREYLEVDEASLVDLYIYLGIIFLILFISYFIFKRFRKVVFKR